ncbi:MAG: hypothetical protein EAZ97_06670 [Bacteroidetes bacterium]|nr:MAG: hypothetical protein EAZ97_06670 [Bacteroidota bacterium]
MNQEEIIQKFEAFLEKVEQTQRTNFIKELAKITPKNADSVVEWRSRLHYQDDDQIQAGAYLFVRPAQERPELINFREIFALFLENRHLQMWEIMKDVFESLEKDMISPFSLRMGLALYISENYGSFMFSFLALATEQAKTKFEIKHKEIEQNLSLKK